MANILKDNLTNQHTKASDEHSSFEYLLGELSAKLVNLPLQSIDSAIESSMKALVELFQAIVDFHCRKSE